MSTTTNRRGERRNVCSAFESKNEEVQMWVLLVIYIQVLGVCVLTGCWSLSVVISPPTQSTGHQESGIGTDGGQEGQGKPVQWAHSHQLELHYSVTIRGIPTW